MHKYIIQTLEPAIKNEYCAWLPYRPNLFKEVYYDAAMICQTDFALTYWPQPEQAYQGSQRIQWGGAQVILVKPDANITFLQAPSHVICPQLWNNQRTRCARAQFRASKSIAMFNAQYPFWKQVESTLMPATQATEPNTSTALSNLTATSTQNSLERDRRLAAILSVYNALGFDTWAIRTTVNKVIQMQQLTGKQALALKEAIDNVVHDFNVLQDTKEKERLEENIAKLLDILSEAIETQITWARDEVNIFRQQITHTQQRAHKIFQSPNYPKIPGPFNTFQYGEFSSNCRLTPIGSYCRMHVHEDIWRTAVPNPRCNAVPVRVFRYDILDDRCLMASNIQGRAAAKLNMTHFGKGLSLQQIHKIFTASSNTAVPMYIAVDGDKAAFIDAHMWETTKQVVVQPNRAWQWPYPVQLYQENWNVPEKLNTTKQNIYIPTSTGMSFYTNKGRNFHIYSCTTKRPFSIYLSPGAHAMNYIADNAKQCVDGKNGINHLYQNPPAEEVLDTKEYTPRYTVAEWQLPDPTVWNNTVNNLLLAITSAHLGKIKSTSGHVLQPKYNISWNQDRLDNISYLPQDQMGSTSFGHIFRETGKTLLQTLDFTKTAREDLKKLIQKQEDRFTNLTKNFTDGAMDVMQNNTLKWLSTLQHPITIATTIVTTVVSIAFTCYKIHTARRNKSLLRIIHKNTDMSKQATEHKQTSDSDISNPKIVSFRRSNLNCRQNCVSSDITIPNDKRRDIALDETLANLNLPQSSSCFSDELRATRIPSPLAEFLTSSDNLTTSLANKTPSCSIDIHAPQSHSIKEKNH
jgi:hypothetical protein